MCNSVQCGIGESCASNICKCGSIASCIGLSTGSYCDPAGNDGLGVCKCSSSLASCEGLTTGDTCDSDNNVCRCGTGDSCAGHLEGSFCDGTTCACSATTPACNSGAACVNGICQGIL